MRLFSIVAIVAVSILPALAHSYNRNHRTPENPTIILGIVGGSIMMRRYIRSRLTE